MRVGLPPLCVVLFAALFRACIICPYYPGQLDALFQFTVTLQQQRKNAEMKWGPFLLVLPLQCVFFIEGVVDHKLAPTAALLQ